MIKTTATILNRTVTDIAGTPQEALNIILCELRGERVKITFTVQPDGTGSAIGTIVEEES